MYTFEGVEIISPRQKIEPGTPTTMPTTGKQLPTITIAKEGEGGFKWWYLAIIFGGAFAMMMLAKITMGGGPEVEIKKPKKVEVELVPTVRAKKEK